MRNECMQGSVRPLGQTSSTLAGAAVPHTRPLYSTHSRHSSASNNTCGDERGEEASG